MKRILPLLALVGTSAFAVNVSDVKVKILDGFGGDTSSVLTRCQTKPGSVYDPVVVTRDVNSLKDSKEYQDISVEAKETPEGIVVTFSVFRKMRFQGPLIAKGNAAVSEAKIADEAGLKDGTLYGEGEFAVAAEKVRALYRRRHYPQATVKAEPTVLADGDGCMLTMIVDEGPLMKVGEWRFEGLSDVDPAEVRARIDVYPWWNPIGWFTDEPETVDAQAQAALKIAAYLAELGYLDAVVENPVAVPAADGRVDYVFKVNQGPRYTIGKMTIEGVTCYPVEKVAEMSDLPAEGSVAGSKILDEAAHRIAVTVGSGSQGLADSQVTPRWLPREDDPTVADIVFKVTEGQPVVISQVVIEGNNRTKDKVIRRSITLGPGDNMLADRAEQSKHKLENLDYFSRVRYFLRESETQKGKNDQGAAYRDLVYEVEEKGTGNFMFGVGASSIDSVYVYSEIQQTNFDLFAPGKMFRGAGQKGRLSVQAGPRIQTYEASVTEPHLFDRLLELTVEGYRRQRWYDEYDIIRSGAAVTLAYPAKFLNPKWLVGKSPDKYVVFGSFGARLSTEFIEFDDITHGNWLYHGRTVSLTHEDDKYGDAFETVGRLFWTRSTLDRPRMPTQGSRTQLFADLGGGDNSFWRLGINHRNYYNVVERYNHVLMLALRAETIDAISGDVPIYNRMFLGGPRSIRGLEYRHVSPMARRLRRDTDEPTGSYMPWGGQTLVCANLEYTIPIVKMLRLAAFTDLGSVGEDAFDFDFSDTFAWSVGLGIRLDIPQFPIRLDFAKPIKKPDHADEEVFSFSIGYDF